MTFQNSHLPGQLFVVNNLGGIEIMPNILSSNIILIFLKFQDFSRTFTFFSFFQYFSRSENLFSHCPGFLGFPGCVETLVKVFLLLL